MELLTDEAVETFLTDHPGWSREGDELVRIFEFADFTGSMGFVTRVALMAERANHHPDIDIRWNEVRIALTTHSEGGLTGKDTDLAGKLGTLI
jgi:4a-hydroxytetrahydrobiopterin dehydratase